MPWLRRAPSAAVVSSASRRKAALFQADEGSFASARRKLAGGSRHYLDRQGVGGMTMSSHVLCDGAFWARSDWV